ncbi:MAG TPA: MBL fold metallo-hydrolase [Acidobacteriota bacterium]|nr:MBL fold metallo-hydrolase [Acidobacteriota bacterium]
MASLGKRLPRNVEGEFFVDSTCINCDTCRQIAPDVFEDDGDYSFVQAQPDNEKTRREATRALLACPTGSIGTTGENLSHQVISDFPFLIEDGVYYCGFNSAKSYGGHSYFVQHPDGNWLIDSPRFLPHLTRPIEELGGIRFIFLTHRDDVAEAASYARKFKAERIIHRDELSAQPDAERIIDGVETINFHPDFQIIPTPGHTRGHMVLCYRNRFLFTGDHLWWSRVRQGLSASADYCWYSFPEQLKSLAKLKNYSFEWVLPGHGQRVHLPAEQMQHELGQFLKNRG